MEPWQPNRDSAQLPTHFGGQTGSGTAVKLQVAAQLLLLPGVAETPGMPDREEVLEAIRDAKSKLSPKQLEHHDRVMAGAETEIAHMWRRSALREKDETADAVGGGPEAVASLNSKVARRWPRG